MRWSRVQLLVAAPSAGHTVSNDNVSACIYRDNTPYVVDIGGGRGQNRASLLGGVPERSKGSDCKSDGLAFVGSNPTPSTRQSESNLRTKMQLVVDRRKQRALVVTLLRWNELCGGYGSMVEPQPSKLKVRVRFPLPAPSRGCLLECRNEPRSATAAAGSSIAHIAQSVEHFLGKEEATGSNPVVSTTIPEIEHEFSVTHRDH